MCRRRARRARAAVDAPAGTGGAGMRRPPRARSQPHPRAARALMSSRWTVSMASWPQWPQMRAGAPTRPDMARATARPRPPTPTPAAAPARTLENDVCVMSTCPRSERVTSVRSAGGGAGGGTGGAASTGAATAAAAAPSADIVRRSRGSRGGERPRDGGRRECDPTPTRALLRASHRSPRPGPRAPACASPPLPLCWALRPSRARAPTCRSSPSFFFSDGVRRPLGDGRWRPADAGRWPAR